MNIDSHKSLTTRIEPSQLRRCSSIPALTILVACAPISSYDEEGLKAFHMNVGRLYIEGHALFKIIVGDDFNTKNIEGVVTNAKNVLQTLRRRHEHAVSVIQRAMERTMLGISLYTSAKGIPEFRGSSTNEDLGCR
ncbi:hypothetical protein V3C99_006248 [Haemonchus contortus]